MGGCRNKQGIGLNGGLPHPNLHFYILFVIFLKITFAHVHCLQIAAIQILIG